MKRAVIIVAGGHGLRMGSDIPKQFLEIKGIPVLCRTIRQFIDFDPEIKIFTVLPASHISYWKQIAPKYLNNNSIEIIEGGNERFFSVKNAVDKLDDDIDITGVHDGVRPLVSTKCIAECYAHAALEGNAVPCLAPPESIRISESNGDSHIINRDTIKLIQTPQVFHTDILKRAYLQPYSKEFTDDASVVEKIGTKINLIPGIKQNIKITTFEDLEYAEFILNRKH